MNRSSTCHKGLGVFVPGDSRGNDFIWFHVPGNFPENTPNLMVCQYIVLKDWTFYGAPGAPPIDSQCHPTVEISTMLHEFWLACQRTCLSSMNWPDRRPVQRQRFSWWSVWWQKNSCDMPCLCKRRAKPMLWGGKLSKNKKHVVSHITRWSPLDSKLDANSSYIYI